MPACRQAEADARLLTRVSGCSALVLLIAVVVAAPRVAEAGYWSGWISNEKGDCSHLRTAFDQLHYAPLELRRVRRMTLRHRGVLSPK